MTPRIWIASSVCAFVYGFSAQTAMAGWSHDAGLIRARDASSLIISVKKHKNDGEDDNHHKKKSKNAKNDQSEESTSESDQGSKGGKTTSDSTTSTQASSKATTAPNTATTNQNVLWGDYFYTNPQQ